MLRLMLIASFALVASGAGIPIRPSLIGQRIVGGENASIEEAPYQVMIIFGIGDIVDYLTCGGVILSADIVLTSGSCAYDDPIAFKVRAGSDDMDLDSGQKVNVSRIIRHEDFNIFGFENNIAIFFLASELIIDGVTIAPISLPAQGQEVAEGTLAIATGFGIYTEVGPYPDKLQKVTMPIYNQSACIENYAALYWGVYDYNICTGLEDGGKDACHGDAGGPLVIGSQLIGINSFSYGCALAGFPGVWTRVSFYVDWIRENTGL